MMTELELKSSILPDTTVPFEAETLPDDGSIFGSDEK